MAIDRTFKAADGTELVVRTYGHGRSIVFPHGSNGGLDSWAEIAASFPAYSVWLIARRGYPPSGIPFSRNTFEVEAADVLLVARAAAEETGQRGHLVGGPYGATLAPHPATMSTGARSLAGTVRAADGAVGSAPDASALRIPKALCCRGVCRSIGCIHSRRGPHPRTGTGWRVERSHCYRRGPGRRHRGRWRPGGDVRRHHGLSRWTTIDLPILLIQGGDTWAPLSTVMDELAAVLPAARRVAWEGESQFLATSTVPGLVGAALRSFFGEVEGS